MNKPCVELVTIRNRHRYETALQEMYAMRFRSAIEMGWTLPDARDGLDKDAFDRPDTVYVLQFDNDRRVIGCGRVNPTTKPTLLSDVFPDFCDLAGVPNSPSIYEYSRCMIEKEPLTLRQFVMTRARINVAVNEYCLAVGIPRVAMLTYKRHYPLILRNWRTRPLGSFQRCEQDDAVYIACLSDMTAEGLQKLKTSQYIDGDVLDFVDGLEPEYLKEGAFA